MGRPRKDATPPDTPPKKERLTLTQLAGYDDILTDALVDHVCHDRYAPRHVYLYANKPLRCISGPPYERIGRNTI